MREITEDLTTGLHFQADALGALQESAEAAVVEIFSEASLMAAHAKRITLQARDIKRVLDVMKKY